MSPNAEAMSKQRASDAPAAPACGPGDMNCPHSIEVQRLRERVRALSEQVRTDELTGLYNFRYFTRALGLEMERTRRSGLPTCLIMCDLDRFKAINDQYGHETGNLVLQQVAGLVVGNIRRVDICCRYGGDEFALVLPDTTLHQGLRFANRLRLAIGGATLEVGIRQIRVEASFGAGVYRRGDDFDEKTFVEQVDGHLYRAKQEGRNRVAHQPGTGDE